MQALRQIAEAETNALLEHAGVVPVYDAGQRRVGTAYHAMRVIRGRVIDCALV